MAFIEERIEGGRKAGAFPSGVSLALIFTATIFLSATLLFSVQPLFTKLILPLLGGSSNVWNTAMVFFQAMLLGGYIYAHLLSRYASFRVQIGVHLAVTAIGLLFLPLAIGEGITTPESGMPTLWLLSLFFMTVGAPFFALSANAPLLQRWFSLTDHKDANDPYFLYAASNAGSLLILCAYPVLIEPVLGLKSQTGLWAIGYGGLIAFIFFAGLSGVLSKKEIAVAPNASSGKGNTQTLTPWKTIAFWLLLAFVPSSLMLGVTSYMTNNIASSPFLWIVPLALYLLTFVIAFAKNPIITSTRIGRVVPWMALASIAITLDKNLPPLLQIAVSLIGFFMIALYCHLRLVESRPDVSKLTQFYILMSLGGVFGGIFNALLAPLIFDRIYEYGLALLLSAFILTKDKSYERPDPRAFLMLGLAAIAALFFVKYIAPRLEIFHVIATMIAAVLLYAGTLRFNFPTPQKIVLLAALVGTAFWQGAQGIDRIFTDRSFFSTLAVKVTDVEGVTVHKFAHGDTIHNYQARDGGIELEPLSYYTRGGSFDAAITAARRENSNLSVALVGLGAGAMACYEQSGEDWTYFEIDPKVVDMALLPELFSYMESCAPDADIRIGDARQRLADLAPNSQDLIIIDAFSSNAIPAHLVTKEAVELYQSRLSPSGLIFFHTSNRLLDVTSVVVNVAEEAGLASRYIALTTDIPELEAHSMKAHGVLVGKPDQIQRLTADETGWKVWQSSRHIGVWTDDYSSVIGPLLAKRDGDAKAIDLATATLMEQR